MADKSIHKDDVGTAFILTVLDNGVVINLSNSISNSIVFKKPSKVTLIKNASLVDGGITGKIRYITQSGDLNEVGTWSVQAIVQLPSGRWHSDIFTFNVEKNL